MLDILCVYTYTNTHLQISFVLGLALLSYVMLFVLVFVLKSILSDKSVAIPVLFLFSFTLNIFSCPFVFSLGVILVLK